MKAVYSSSTGNTDFTPVSASEMKRGLLYKHVKQPPEWSFLKVNDRTLVFFTEENGVFQSGYGMTNKEKTFVLAPAGTSFTIKNVEE